MPNPNEISIASIDPAWAKNMRGGLFGPWGGRRKWNVYKFLNSIRSRPAMFIGENSLSGLRCLIGGYAFAQDDFGLRCDWGESTSPWRHLHDWVATRFNRSSAVPGWCNVILDETGNEEKAMEVFFDLVDKFALRRPEVIARVRLPPDHPLPPIGTGVPRRMTGNPLRELQPPRAIEIVRYSADRDIYFCCDYSNRFRRKVFGAYQEDFFETEEEALERGRIEFGIQRDQWIRPKGRSRRPAFGPALGAWSGPRPRWKP